MFSFLRLNPPIAPFRKRGGRDGGGGERETASAFFSVFRSESNLYIYLLPRVYALGKNSVFYKYLALPRDGATHARLSSVLRAIYICQSISPKILYIRLLFEVYFVYYGVQKIVLSGVCGKYVAKRVFRQSIYLWMLVDGADFWLLM